MTKDQRIVKTLQLAQAALMMAADQAGEAAGIIEDEQFNELWNRGGLGFKAATQVRKLIEELS